MTNKEAQQGLQAVFRPFQVRPHCSRKVKVDCSSQNTHVSLPFSSRQSTTPDAEHMYGTKDNFDMQITHVSRIQLKYIITIKEE